METTKQTIFNIRKATIDDSELILSLIKDLAKYEKLSSLVVATVESIKENIFNHKYAEVIIAEENSEVVGFALYFYNFSTFLGKPGLYLEDIYVKPTYRNKGYGKKLFIKLAKIARDNNCGRMEWSCLDWNEPSIKFYKSLGANPMDEWTTYRLNGSEISLLANRED